MGDLIEFLLARIAEDEKWLTPCDCHIDGEPLVHGRDCGIRVLVECKAKRRIVERCGLILEAFSAQNGGPGRPLWHDVNRRERGHANNALADLAAIYADHPDYREEWKP